jgi:serine protease Do
MLKNLAAGALRRTALCVAGGGALAALLTGGFMFASSHDRGTVHAGGFEAVHSPEGVAPIPASTGYADLVAKVAPSIVTIRSERKVKEAALPFSEDELPPFLRGFGGHLQPHREGGLGSGVIVSADGYLLTNHHVVKDADKVRVELSDRRSLDAKIVGVDPASDLAVLKIDAKGLPVLPFGNSDALRVGDVVLAFGNPLGVGQTVTMGIVSAKGRATSVGDGSFEDFLQTDAPINQGNSGGALVSTTGQLVGINSQIVSPSGGNIGIGFAIPSRMAENVMTQLVDHGEVRRGKLGVTVQGITSDLAQSLGLSEVKGALVSAVNEDSPASRAGIERGDVIVSVNGRPVTDSNALRNHIASTNPGSEVTLGLIRDGHPKTVQATLAQIKSAQAKVDTGEPGEGGRLGLAVQPVTPQMAKELGLDSTTGLYVAQVEADSPAADAGIQAGDVIERVNRKPVTDVAGLKAAVKDSGGKPALVLVTRKGDSLYLTIEPPRA